MIEQSIYATPDGSLIDTRFLCASPGGVDIFFEVVMDYLQLRWFLI
jgi:hypothetical protein